MKRYLLPLAMTLVASCAHVPPAAAGPLNLRFTMPAFENAGTCAAPVMLPMAADATLRGVYSWSGPASGSDSTYAAQGAAVSVLKYVPSGSYTVRVHAARGANTWLCDTTITVVVVNPPAMVSVQP